ncbi:MAG: NADH-quinone oxidoreductase subunit H [Phycisphaerae bacterium]|jgi:formate hydrogenlyase subunit 4
MTLLALAHVLLALAGAPLLLGVINRVKAFFAGRCGPRLLQPYSDLFKLLRKGAVYSRTTSWVFRAGPVVGLGAVLAALALVPLGSIPALLAFPGDLLLFAYLLGLMRFVTILAAMDTGSPFEGMGASREAQFSMLAEPALLLGLAAIAVAGKSTSLSGMLGGLSLGILASPAGPALLLVASALLVVLLTENARIPVDDPNTHLELTMIHEVMVLDHGGVDLGLIQYAAALKFWALAAIFVSVAVPVRTGYPLADLAVGAGLMLAVAVVVGIIESTMARLRLLRVPQLLVTACVLSALALAIVLR